MVAAAVVGVALALYEASLLEGVEDADELAAVELERVGDRGLCFAGAFAEQGEDAVVEEVVSASLELSWPQALTNVPRRASRKAVLSSISRATRTGSRSVTCSGGPLITGISVRLSTVHSNYR